MRTIIQLNEIPEMGLDFEFTQNSGELNSILEDLIADQAYLVKGHISNFGKSYEIKGHFQIHKNDICSRCGQDMDLDLGEKIHEILMPSLEEPRNSHYSKPNHYSDMMNDGPNVTFFDSLDFNLGEFLHEQIAIALPFTPTCQECSEKGQTVQYDEEFPKDSPFGNLKGIKLPN